MIETIITIGIFLCGFITGAVVRRTMDLYYAERDKEIDRLDRAWEKFVRTKK